MKRVFICILFISIFYSLSYGYYTNQSADIVIGQKDFNTGLSNQDLANSSATTLNIPKGMATDGTKLIVSDAKNHRVLIYNQIPSTHNAPADVVIGQIYFSSSVENQGLGVNSCGPNTLNYPSDVFIYNSKLFISDTNNNRVLIFNTIPSSNNASADIVIGQKDEYSNKYNQNNTVVCSSNTLYNPRGIFVQNDEIFIADSVNNRVLIFNSIPSTHNTGADVVIGQIYFSSGARNQGLGTSSPQSNTLNIPYDVSSDGMKLFISDQENCRVLIYDSIPVSNNASADIVIGQTGMTSNGYGLNSNKLKNPYGVTFANSKLFIVDTGIGSDGGNNRLLIFNSCPTQTANASADIVIGQPNFVSGSSNQGSGQPEPNTLSCPQEVCVMGSKFGVSERNNNRILIFNDLFGAFIEITEVIPNFGYKWTSTRAYIKGSGFLGGSVVKLARSGETDIVGTNVVISTGILACTFNLWGKSLGLWDIVITTGSVANTFSQRFLVTQLSPGYDTSPQASGAIDSAGGTIKVEIASSDIANMELIIPQDAISTNIAISITINISINPPSLPGNIAKVGRVIDLWPSNMEFNKEVEVKIPYKNSDIEKFGIADPNLLDVYTYDANTEGWVKVAKNNIDRTNSLISVKISHFSLYTLGVTVVSDVGSSTIYPNPFKPDEYSKVTFSVPLESEVQIYNVAGELVNSLKDDNKTGKIFWTGINSSGQKVASGIYLCVIKNGTSHSTKKLAIIR